MGNILKLAVTVISELTVAVVSVEVQLDTVPLQLVNSAPEDGLATRFTTVPSS